MFVCCDENNYPFKRGIMWFLVISDQWNYHVTLSNVVRRTYLGWRKFDWRHRRRSACHSASAAHWTLYNAQSPAFNCRYMVNCFRTLSSYIAYLSITALTLPLTLTPPLHKSAECTKLLFLVTHEKHCRRIDIRYIYRLHVHTVVKSFNNWHYSLCIRELVCEVYVRRSFRRRFTTESIHW